MKNYTKGYKAEILDQKPLAIPVGFKKPETMEEILNRLIQNRFRDVELNGEETFEEADDFDCDDDFDPASPWEEVFDKDGVSLGFLDQNRYQPARIYERRLDDRDKSYPMDKNSNSSDGSVQSDTSGSDS